MHANSTWRFHLCTTIYYEMVNQPINEDTAEIDRDSRFAVLELSEGPASIINDEAVKAAIKEFYESVAINDPADNIKSLAQDILENGLNEDPGVEHHPEDGAQNPIPGPAILYEPIVVNPAPNQVVPGPAVPNFPPVPE